MRFLLFLFVLLTPFAATARNFNFESFTLDNGLQVVVIPNHRMPVVAHMVWYKVGAMDETPGKSGLAHFLEHLMFKGTDDVPAGQFSARIAELGGVENAFTTMDYTAYFQKLSKENLPLAMKLEADRMLNLSLKPADFDSEKLVILEEQRARIGNNPGAILQEEMLAALFRNHPYGRPLIGWVPEIKALQQQDAMNFYKAHYAPNNAIVAIGGDIDITEARKLAEEYYGKLKPAPIAASLIPQEPPQRAARSVIYRDARVTQSQYLRYVQAPSFFEDAQTSYALQVLEEILGGGRSGRLYRKLVVEDKIASGAGASYDGDKKGPSIFGVYAVPLKNVARDKIQAAVASVLRDIAAKPPTEAELERSKNSLLGEVIYAQDSLYRMAYLAGETLTIGGKLSDIEEWPDKISAVTAEDVRRAAGLIAADMAVEGWLLPEERK